MKRISLLKPYILNKVVLDIGCVEHDWKTSENNPDWLHKQIKKYAASVLGTDYLTADVKELQTRGYNMIVCNAEDFSLNQKFDIIIAGELIEHLSNPGKFLECCREHLEETGKLIITTPNAFAAGNVLRIMKLVFGQETLDNEEHVNWYNRQNLYNLAKRHGYKVERYTTFYPDRYSSFTDMLPFDKVKSKIFLVLKKA